MVEISPRGVAVDRCWYYEKRIALRHGSRDKATLWSLPAGGVRDDLRTLCQSCVASSSETRRQAWAAAMTAGKDRMAGMGES